MECRRCKGLMVQDWVCDLMDEAPVFRCVNCGAIVFLTLPRSQDLTAPKELAALSAPQI
jgi:hypothetical protein